MFVAAGTDMSVRLYDEETKNLVSTFDGHTGKIFCSKFLHNEEKSEFLPPNMMASGGWDFTVKLWDPRTPDPAAQIDGPFICGDAIEMLGQSMILTGSHKDDEPLQLWDIRMP